MKAKITNNTSYNITLVDNTLIKCYDTVTINITNKLMKTQIENLAQREVITVTFF